MDKLGAQTTQRFRRVKEVARTDSQEPIMLHVSMSVNGLSIVYLSVIRTSSGNLWITSAG
jgi:hypothetical protein